WSTQSSGWTMRTSLSNGARSGAMFEAPPSTVNSGTAGASSMQTDVLLPTFAIQAGQPWDVAFNASDPTTQFIQPYNTTKHAFIYNPTANAWTTADDSGHADTRLLKLADAKGRVAMVGGRTVFPTVTWAEYPYHHGVD